MCLSALFRSPTLLPPPFHIAASSRLLFSAPSSLANRCVVNSRADIIHTRYSARVELDDI